MKSIKNIIFDLGGVLLDIDYNKTIDAFEQLGIENFKSNFSPEKMDDFFAKLETGKISETAFYECVKAISQKPLLNHQIKNAWNALLLGLRTESLNYLEQIAPQYRLFLLSNTNTIHLDAFYNIIERDTGQPDIDRYFNKVYYSNIIGLRKPDTACYQFVLQDAGIIPEETLFIDDLAINIAGAGNLGIKTHHLLAHERIENLGL